MIVGEMSVAGGDLHLGVPEQLPDHRQTFTDQEAATGEREPEVVKPQSGQARLVVDAPHSR